METRGILREEHILALLKQVIDPELMVNVIDLGLVYNIEVNNKDRYIQIEMTLTSRGCPLGDVIIQGAEQLLKKHYPEYKINVKLVWTPAWSTELISEEGKSHLGQ